MDRQIRRLWQGNPVHLECKGNQKGTCRLDFAGPVFEEPCSQAKKNPPARGVGVLSLRPAKTGLIFPVSPKWWVERKVTLITPNSNNDQPTNRSTTRTFSEPMPLNPARPISSAGPATTCALAAGESMN